MVLLRHFKIASIVEVALISYKPGYSAQLSLIFERECDSNLENKLLQLFMSTNRPTLTFLLNEQSAQKFIARQRSQIQEVW